MITLTLFSFLNEREIPTKSEGQSEADDEMGVGQSEADDEMGFIGGNGLASAGRRDVGRDGAGISGTGSRGARGEGGLDTGA